MPKDRVVAQIAEPPVARNDDACSVGETPVLLAELLRAPISVGHTIRFQTSRSQTVSRCLQYRAVQHRLASRGFDRRHPRRSAAKESGSVRAHSWGEKGCKVHSKKENGFVERDLGTRLAGAGFGSVSQLQWAAHTPEGGNSSQRSSEGMNMTSRPRKGRSRGASGNSSNIPAESNGCR